MTVLTDREFNVSAASVDDAAGPTEVRLEGLATAVPPHELPQDLVQKKVEAYFGKRFPQFLRMSSSFAAAGIERRYSVAPFEWFENPRNWPERTERYLEGGTALFVDAARRALAEAGLAADQIDTVVTVSSTGIATPTLEARAFAEIGFRSNIHRVPVFGLGCAGGVSGLALATRLARATPGSRVLLVCIEACTLSFRDEGLTKADFIAGVLFGDGAAAVCLASGSACNKDAPLIGEGFEHLWPDTLNIMGWNMHETGFGVVFDRSIPPFVDAHFRDALELGLAEMDLKLDEVDRLVCHPGGTKVVEAIERTMAFTSGQLDHEREVLRNYGNMSAPTVLFVLERVLADAPRGQMVLTALGPGFTAAMLPIRFPG